MTIKHRAVCVDCDWTGEPGLMNAAARDAGEHREETGHAAKIERAAVTDGGRDQSADEIEHTVKFRKPDGPRCENCGAPLWEDTVSCDTCGHLDPSGVSR